MNFNCFFIYSYSELTTHTHQPKKIKGLVIKRINKNGQARIIEHFTDISLSPAVKTTKSSNSTVKSKKIKKRNFSCSQCESSFYKRQELRVSLL